MTIKGPDILTNYAAITKELSAPDRTSVTTKAWSIQTQCD